MKGRLMTVRLKQIVPIYTESISETVKKRMVRCIRNGENLSKYLVLEKDPNHKRYYLLSGYVAYEAYKEAGISVVDCIVKPFRIEQNRWCSCYKICFIIPEVIGWGNRL